MGEPLGSGSYGQVNKVVRRATGEVFAMKATRGIALFPAGVSRSAVSCCAPPCLSAFSCVLAPSILCIGWVQMLWTDVGPGGPLF